MVKFINDVTILFVKYYFMCYYIIVQYIIILVHFYHIYFIIFFGVFFLEEYILSSNQNKSLEEIGIKAAALNHMKKLNLNVPEYVIVSSKLSEKYFSSIKDKINFIIQEFDNVEEISVRIKKLIDENELQPFLIQELQKAIDVLKKFNIENVEGKLRLVLRSSKTYISGLNSRVFFNLQNVLEVEKNIRELFKDHFSKDAILERKNKDHPILHFNIPVILQKMIIPDFSGIIFPVPDVEDEYYITVWKGFGHEMNFSDADHYVVDHKNLLLKKLLNNKPGKIVFFDESADSITFREVLHEEEFEPFLSQDQIVDLCEVYSLNKKNLGGLALEFKVKNNVLYFISLKDSKIYFKAVDALKELEEKSKKDENKFENTFVKESKNMSENILEKNLEETEKEIYKSSIGFDNNVNDTFNHAVNSSVKSLDEKSQILEEKHENHEKYDENNKSFEDNNVVLKDVLDKLESIEEKIDFLLKKFS